MKRKTTEQFIKEMKEINSNIEIIGEYTGNKNKIQVRCLIDDYMWFAAPSNLLNGRGCPKCGKVYKRTHDEFILEIQTLHPNIIVTSNYSGLKEKVDLRCMIDGYIWSATPSNLLQGKGCPQCGGCLKRTHEEFINEVNKIHPNLKVVSKYINNHTKIKCRCLVHNNDFEINPSSLLKGYGCRYCSGSLRTHNQFVDEINNINKNITILDTYKDTKTKILVKCNIDGYEWKTTPSILLGGSGCPRCSGKLKRTHQEFVDDLRLVNDKITVIGNFVNLQKHIKVKCRVCNNVWNPVANSLLQVGNCPKCSIISITKTHDHFINELQTVNKNIEVLEEYISANKKIKVRCLIDKHEWYVKPNNLLQGFGCPVCNESKGEKCIKKYLDDSNINYITQMKYNGLVGVGNGLLSYDFYLPDFNLLIEYQGIQHEQYIKGMHKTKNKFEVQQEHDRRKNKYAIDNNIKLLEIWYYDFNNITDILDVNLNI